MKLLHRVGYYLLGLSIGIVFVAFFFSGKKTSCNYGPQARALADFSKKTLVEDSTNLLNGKTIDSTVFKEILDQAHVDFSKSETQLDSCKRYLIRSIYKQKPYELKVENCVQEIRVLSVKPAL